MIFFNLCSSTDDEHDKVHNFLEGTTLLENETPKLGMEFDDAEAAYEFYNSYGAKKGFSIKKDNIRTVHSVVKFHSFVVQKKALVVSISVEIKETEQIDIFEF
jgi:hypothetical protein